MCALMNEGPQPNLNRSQMVVFLYFKTQLGQWRFYQENKKGGSRWWWPVDPEAHFLEGAKTCMSLKRKQKPEN